EGASRWEVAQLIPESLPLLDLMGERDQPAQQSARQRRKSLRYGGNKNYQQGTIIGAGRDFIGREQMLLFRLVGWLNRNPPNAAPGNYKALAK
ncbi:MAG: hypothetical protein HQL47_10255, partial [Gammaproteobacteria bacterium]|nr:hypothetical protein [Gammaproteobacteria bacterium]